MSNKIVSAFAALAVGVALAVAAPVAASASAAPQVTASPASIAVGQSTTVTATGLGGLETAGFGLDDNSAGTFAGGSTSAEVAVSNGTATVEFTAETAGTFTIAVGDGETVLATTSITIAAATPTPTATPAPTASPPPAPTAAPVPTPTASPVPAPAGDSFPWTIVWLVLGLLVLAGIVTVIVLLARRRSDGDGPSGGAVV